MAYIDDFSCIYAFIFAFFYSCVMSMFLKSLAGSQIFFCRKKSETCQKNLRWQPLRFLTKLQKSRKSTYSTLNLVIHAWKWALLGNIWLSAYFYFDKNTKITKIDVYVSKYGDICLDMDICGSFVFLHTYFVTKYENHENSLFDTNQGVLGMCVFWIYFLWQKNKISEIFILWLIYDDFSLFMGVFEVFLPCHFFFMTTTWTLQNTSFYEEYDTNMPKIKSFPCFRLQCVYE